MISKGSQCFIIYRKRGTPIIGVSKNDKAKKINFIIQDSPIVKMGVKIRVRINEKNMIIAIVLMLILCLQR